MLCSQQSCRVGSCTGSLLAAEPWADPTEHSLGIAKVFDPSGRAVAQRGQVRVFHPCLEAQHPFHLATLLPRAISQRGVLSGDTVNASPLWDSCYKLADLTQRRAQLQEPGGCDPPPGLESCGEKVWAEERTGRQAGAGGDQPSCANLLPTHSSHPETLTLLPPEMQLHSFQLSPTASAAREGFPALLSPAFPSGAESALSHSKLRKASRLHQERWLSQFWEVQ